MDPRDRNPRDRDDQRRYREYGPGSERNHEAEHDAGQRRRYAHESRDRDDTDAPERGAGPQRGFHDASADAGRYARRPYASREPDYNYDPRGDREYGYSTARGSMVSPGWDHWRGDDGPRQGRGEFGGGSYEQPAYGREPRAGGQSFRGHGPQGYERSDERLTEVICERMTDDPDIDPREVRVQVKSGVVTLEGRVDDRWMKHHIEDLVDACAGVRSIENRIRVGAIGTSAQEPDRDAGGGKG